MVSEVSGRAAIGRFVDAHGITQRELAEGIGRTESFVSMLASGASGASQGTVASILTFLSGRLGRRVTYEEAFGEPLFVDCPVAPAPACTDPEAA